MQVQPKPCSLLALWGRLLEGRGIDTSTSNWYVDPREETAIVLLWQVQTPSLVPDIVIQFSISGQREWFKWAALFGQNYWPRAVLLLVFLSWRVDFPVLVLVKHLFYSWDSWPKKPSAGAYHWTLIAPVSLKSHHSILPFSDTWQNFSRKKNGYSGNIYWINPETTMNFVCDSATTMKPAHTSELIYRLVCIMYCWLYIL